MRYLHRSVTLLVACFAAQSASQGMALDYVVERVASGLAQPTFTAQAPGDPANIIYYSTRITAASGTGGGFGSNGTPVAPMGGIFRYDMNTRTATQVMSLSYRNVYGDEGLVGFAFSPDFNTPGAPGYQKLYVSSSQYNGSTGNTNVAPTERVEEYTVNGPNGTVPLDANNHATLTRTILQYTNVNTQQNHTVDWIAFDPTTYSHAVGTADRNYLYIVAGDGDLGGSAQNRPEQKANSVLGKVLRVDVDSSHGDVYDGTHVFNGVTLPNDANKNFAIPSTNPIPLYNAAHPGATLVGTHKTFSGGTPLSADYGTAQSPAALPEIYFTGTRNTFRMSIDRQTGDLWMGDVGENTREEVNFLKAGTYNGQQPPIDFGYASREGTVPTQGTSPPPPGTADAVANSTGATTLQWNLSDGSNIVINSTNPIREGDHSTSNTTDHPLTSRSSYIGGYMYRGPIASLQGKYFWSDYVSGIIYQLDSFDRNTPLASYSGTNLNQNASGLAALGTRTKVSDGSAASLLQSLIFDRTDSSYSSAIGSSFGIGRAVSFGEDNLGNVYIIDFGGPRVQTSADAGFGNDYPNAGLGEIFKLVPVGDFDRDGLLTVGDISAMAGALADTQAYKLASGITYDGALVKLGDVDGNGALTNTDVQALIVYLANNGGGSGSLAAVPEPASGAMLVVGGISLAFFARNRLFRYIVLLR